MHVTNVITVIIIQEKRRDIGILGEREGEGERERDRDRKIKRDWERYRQRVR